MTQISTEARDTLRTLLADALAAYTLHSSNASGLLDQAVDPDADTDPDADRTDAAVEAQLANAAAVMVQAMATLLAANPA